MNASFGSTGMYLIRPKSTFCLFFEKKIQSTLKKHFDLVNEEKIEENS